MCHEIEINTYLHKINIILTSNSSHSAILSIRGAAVDVPYMRQMQIWNFRPKGDGRSGPLGPLLPVKNLTFWYT